MIEDCQDQAALQKQLDGIDGDIQELDELIDEILTYARLEQGGPVFSLQENSVTDIVRQVVSEQQMVRPELDIEGNIDEISERWALSDIELGTCIGRSRIWWAMPAAMLRARYW